MNPNTTYHCSSQGITVCYMDTLRHYNLAYGKASKEIQLYGNSLFGKQYQQVVSGVEDIEFSSIQTRLYKQVMHGLALFNNKILQDMSFNEKLSIEIKYRKAQRVLNSWKQSIVSREVDSFLLKLFPKSQEVKQMVDITESYTDNFLTSPQSFMELGISRSEVVVKLISVGILPDNFFRLKNDI